jgi:4-hydroxy-tetrahydrodipicolinate synthase
MILALGGYGVISVVSHLVGNQVKDMIYKFLEGKTAEAAKIHRDMLPLVNAMFVIANPIPVKYAVNQVGFRVGGTRLPLCEPDEKTAKQIMDVVKKYKIDLPI